MKVLNKNGGKSILALVLLAAWIFLSLLIYISTQALSPIFDKPIGNSSVSRDTEYPYGRTAACRPPFEYITYEGKTSRNGFPFLESIKSEAVVIEECVERRTQETESYISTRVLNLLFSVTVAAFLVWISLYLYNKTRSAKK